MRSRTSIVRNWLHLALALTFLLTANGLAETFVSYNGGFHISCPDNWEQVDYQTADYYIRQATGNLNYEAVFAAKDSPSVFEGVYVILTIDTSGSLTQPQIDSAIGVIVQSLGRELKEIKLASLTADLSEEIVGFDSELQTLAAMSDVTEEGGAPRKNVLVQRFYDRGIANFYYYGPDSLLTEGLGSFSEMLTSFSTEEVGSEDADVKVADLESRGSSESTNDLVLYGGLTVILLCLVMVRIRQRKRK
ncbi:MAG: hypothetical protein GY867_05600 [bacterium]|nr:hypothetical protein [bacterium]